MIVAVTSRATRKASYCNRVPTHDDPLVTVVIPTRDRLPLLREAVASVFAQRFRDWRLVVVDDASTDGTPAWLAQMTDSRIDVVRCDPGVERSAARNLGLDRATTPYVLFLDDDDLLKPHALTCLLRGVAGHPEAFAAAGPRVFIDELGHHRRYYWPHWTVCRRAWVEVIAGWIAITGQTLFRTDLLRESGGWTVGMSVAEDQDVWLRLGYDRPAVLVPRAVMRYRLHGPSRAPLNTRVVERELRERFIAALPEPQRRLGEEAMAAWRLIIASNQAFYLRRHREAARDLLEAARACPFVFTSPITGPGLVMSFGKGSIAGAFPRPAGLALEDVIHGGREVLRWAPRQRWEGADARNAPEFWALPFELPDDVAAEPATTAERLQEQGALAD